MRHGMENTTRDQRSPPVHRFSFLLAPQRPHYIHVVGLVTTTAAEGRFASKSGAAGGCHVGMRQHNVNTRSEGRHVHKLEVGDEVAHGQAELPVRPVDACM